VIFGALLTRFPIFLAGEPPAAPVETEPSAAEPETAGVPTRPDTDLL
jgi:hypothetical protein